MSKTLLHVKKKDGPLFNFLDIFGYSFSYSPQVLAFIVFMTNSLDLHQATMY